MISGTDVTLVAARRSDLLERTLRSFHANLFARLPVRRLFVNIDPIWGDAPEDGEVERICRQYFPHSSHVFRRPERPSFGAAVKWLWRQPEGDWFLHLEDDWELMRPIDLDRLAREMQVPKVKQITLRRPRRLWRKPQTSPGFSTSPSFIDVGFARMASERMQAELDPEKQFYKGRNPELIAAVRPYLLYYHGGRFARPLIADTGRAWREQRGIRKIRQGARTVWSSPRARDGTA